MYWSRELQSNVSILENISSKLGIATPTSFPNNVLSAAYVSVPPTGMI